MNKYNDKDIQSVQQMKDQLHRQTPLSKYNKHGRTFNEVLYFWTCVILEVFMQWRSGKLDCCQTFKSTITKTYFRYII